MRRNDPQLGTVSHPLQRNAPSHTTLPSRSEKTLPVTPSHTSRL